ncbi:hypothetical protein D9Q98_007913 [Chlorella vulgaris]|uniref:TLC domain-containing protein n=1 Tax=Chlorella vulgaris TaxID=3077 RepID=A0A9D4THP5_CHLVU|nr:hypothetical protein D9Q98_007913 [Chlorella vulgaris]
MADTQRAGRLAWLIGTRDRPEYALEQPGFSHQGLEWELAGAVKMLVVLVVARFVFNMLLKGPTARLAARRGSDAHHRDGRRLLEELWVTAGNLLMLGAALYVMLRKNGGCWFLNTDTCLAGWPNIVAEPEVARYYQLELAWYLHMLLKPVLHYGLPDGRDMLVHHFASLALILVSYGTNLTRIGVVVLGIFAISNPLLHIAKICNQLSLGPLKIGGFMVFALAFFLSRVILVPLAVLKPALLDSRRYIPYAVEDFRFWYYVINVLLVGLYFMQLLWMRSIARVLSSASSHGSVAASDMSAKLDPAQRYATGTAQQAGAEVTADGSTPTQATQARHAGRGQQPQTPSPADLPTLGTADVRAEL